MKLTKGFFKILETSGHSSNFFKVYEVFKRFVKNAEVLELCIKLAELVKDL